MNIRDLRLKSFISAHAITTARVRQFSGAIVWSAAPLNAFTQLERKGVPTDPTVIRELRKILQEDPLLKEQNPAFSWDNKWLQSFWDALTSIFRYPLLIVIGIALILGLYFLFRRLQPYLGSKSLNTPSSHHPSSRNKELPPDGFVSLYRDALDQARDQRYKPALILLHKATVEYLLTKIIIAAPGKKYTNNDLKRKLTASQPLYLPFCTISNYAEIAGFSALEITPTDFQQALEAFEKAFL